MRIDPLEIGFRLEKRFEIKFQRDEILPAFCNTAGTLCEFIWQKLQGHQPAVPDFNKLHREVRSLLLSAPGHSWWYRGANLDCLLGQDNLIDNWHWLERALQITLPPLVQDSAGDRPRIPRDCETIHRLVFWIIEHQPERVSWLRLASTKDPPARSGGITREACWIGVRDVLVDVLGIEPHEVVPSAHLIDDLGME